jgi:CheY-like chemotaxis protein
VSPSIRDLGCESVLIVEDEPDILGLLGDMFEDEGLETSRASSATQALKLLRGGLRPDLILLDLVMPGMNGDELLEVLRQDRELCAIPVAVMTGNRGGFEELLERGANDVLAKPFSLERLNEVLAHLCVEKTAS